MSSSSQIDTEFSGISNTSSYPPHNGLAVGPNNIVMAEGSRIEWTNLAGGAPTLQSVYQFFQPLGATATNSLFDPRCFYDSASGRFIVMMDNIGSNGTISNIDIAVSKTSNPNDGWYFASLNTSLTINGQLTSSDRPTISVDATNIYITAPQYNVSVPGYAGTESWVIGKTAGAGGGIYNGGALTVVANQVTPASQGVFSVVAGNNGKTYYACDYSTGSQIVVVLQAYDVATSTFGPASTISLGAIDQGGSYTAQQLGTSLLLDAGDKRIANLQYANGYLYGVSEMKPIGSSVPQVHWFKIDVSNPNAPTLVAQGDISGASLGTNVSTFNGSLAVDGAGDVIINFTASGPNMYPSDYYVFQGATDPAGSFSAPVLYQASSGFFNAGNGSTTQRWGAYSTAIADINNPHAFWISNEYVANNWWQTSVAQIEVKSVNTTVVASVTTSGPGISGGSGDLNTGKVVTLTVNFSAAVTVDTTAGTPTLTLNEGGSATYIGGTGTSAITFSYTVASGQNTPDLSVSSFNLNGATIRDGGGIAADLSGAANFNPAGTLQIDTTAPGAPTGLSLDTTTDSVVKGDGVTNFSQAKIDGTAEAGSTVTLYDTDGTTVLGTGTANATTGAFSITTSVLSDGTHSISAKAIDAADNTGAASTAYAVRVDTAAPAAPTGLSLDATTDSGTLGDGVTNFTQVKIDGTAEAGSTVTLYDTNGTAVLGTGTADATTGAFGIITSVLSNGVHAITAKAADTAGNIGSASAAYSITVNGNGPPAPTSLSLDATTDSGTLGDGVTNFAQVKIDGTAAAGSTVTLYDTNGTTVVGTGTANATTGAFSIATSVLSDGTHSISAKATDAAGNTGAASTAYAVRVDTAAPAAPTSLSLDATTDSGTAGDGITNFSQAKIDGTAEAGSTVTLYDTNGTTVLGTGTANTTTGVFSITTSALSVGAHSISAKATDAAGNTGAASTAYAVRVDTAAPAAPTGLSLDSTTDSGTLGDGITNFTQVKIDGTAEPGSTVTLYDTNGTTVLGTGTANATTGAFGIITSVLSNGVHGITAKAADTAGNIGPASVAYSITINGTAPPAPTGLSLDTTTDSGAKGDGITNFAQVTIDGTAAAGSTVTLYDTNGTTVLGTGVADVTTGAFGITTSTLSSGTHSITAKATDAAGNVSAASTGYAVTIDTAAPGAPTGLALDTTTDSGAAGDGVTSFTQVKIDGTAEAGSTVTLYDTDGTTVLGTGTANATTGAFSITTSVLSDGTHSTSAKATDAAGNNGAASTAYAVRVDTAAPAAPTGLSLDATTDSGTLGDGVTNFTQVKIDGTAEAGSTVTLYDTNGTTVLGTGTANATTGAFGITTSTLASGTHNITAKAVDAAGNASALSAFYAVIVTAAPSTSDVDTLFSGISDRSGYPPHNALAVGPNYIVMSEGSRIEWTNLTGGGGAATIRSVYQFFGSLGSTATNALFDQRAVYDPINQRYIVTMDNIGSSGAVSNIDIAVSKTSNPNDGWYFASLNTALTINGHGTSSDTPVVSVDGSNIYITAPQYNISGGGWQGTDLWVIGDTAGAGGGIYNGGTMTVVANEVTSSSQGIYRVTAGNNGKTYYASSYSGSGQIVVTLQIYDVATGTFGPVSTIGLGNIDQGGSYTAQQLGTSRLLDATDKRVQNLVYANGFLYGVTEEKPIGSSVPLVHWFKINVSNPNSPTLVAQGDISSASLGSNVATFNGSIAVDAAGDVLINFTASGPNMYPGDYYVFHAASDPSNAFSSPVLYQAGSGFFDSGNGSSIQRWGLNSTAIADPANPHSFWVSNEYVANGWWQTSVAQVEVGPVAEAPTLAISNAALTVSAGGSVPLGVQVTPFDADDAVSVTIGGLTGYETITDGLDQLVFSGNSVTLSAAEVNSGLSLHSSYTGSDHPVNNLTLSASNARPGEAATSSALTIVVTDPPVIASASPPSTTLPTNPPIATPDFKSPGGVSPAGLAPPAYTKLAGLLDQYMAAGSCHDASGACQTSWTTSQQAWLGDKELLTKPHS
jgi:hypothetical protein